jgi:[ribosomal protein S18]-alanine N-acetyltransferase
LRRIQSFNNVTLLKLELKTLTNKHLPGILEIDRSCFGGLWSESAYVRELDSPNSDLLGLFVPTDTPLAAMGCLWAILEEAHITILAVHPQYQGQGFGQALLYSLLIAASDRGLERATLEVAATNLAAISLYQKFGFKTAGTRRQYYQDTGEDALILWRGDLQQPEFSRTLNDWYLQISDRLRQAGWNFVDI